MPDPTVPVANPPPSPPPTPTNAPASVSVQSVTPDGGAAEALTVKPGMSTTEFWLTFLITAVGLLAGSGLLTSNTAVQITGFVVATLKSGLYLWSRTQIKTAGSTLAMIAVVMFAFHTSACASADATAINATVTTTKIAQASFEAYDDVHTTEITTKAPDKATGIASLQTWWTESAKIEKLFDGVYAAIAMWATAKDHTHASDVIAAALALSAELHAAGVIK